METAQHQGVDGLYYDTRTEALEAQILILEGRVARQDDALYHQRIVAETSTRKIAQLTEDLTVIAGALRDEATGRGWCREYTTFVHDVNDRTSQPWLRRCTYELTYEVTIVTDAPNITDLSGLFRAVVGDTVETTDFEDATIEEVRVTLSRSDVTP